MGRKQNVLIAGPVAGNRIDIGIGSEFPDSFFIREMKDYRKMSRAELLAQIEQLKSHHALRSKAQQRKAAVAVQDREERLRAILETAVEGIITIDERGIIESANPAVEKIFGYKTREIAGKNVSILMPSPHRQAHDSYLANYRHTGQAKIIGIGREVQGRRKDGTVFPMDLSVSEVNLAGRRMFTGFVRDITERKQAEQSVRDSEERYRSLVIMSPDALFINRKERVVFINSAGLKLFGAETHDQLLGKKIFDLFHPDYHDAIRERTGKLKIGQSVPLVEEKIVRLDGKIVDVEVAASPFQDSQGAAIQVILRDITSRKEAEKALLHYAALVESSDDAIIGTTLDGDITSWNKGAEAIFGFKCHEAVGKNISIIIPPDRMAEERTILEKARRGESVEHYETMRRRKDGRLVDISVTVSPIREPDGKIVGASKVARDITERKQLEKQTLEISEREQRRIGHDLHDGLCQHLAGIELMSEVLEQKLMKRSRSAAQKVGNIAKGVRDAISHTRSLARGLSPVTLESEGLISALQELAVNTEKIFNVTCHFESDPPVLIHDHAAASNLFRIAQEAVSNAIKHGKAKRISISLETVRGKIILRVSDNGSGLPKQFEAKNQKGMGWRIMQSRAGLIGGTMAIESNAAGGVTVICSVPKQLVAVNSRKAHAR